MPRLVIKDLPDDVHDALARSALLDNRSVIQQTVILLRSALNMRQEQASRRNMVIKEIDGFHIKNSDKLPDPAAFVKEDREK